MQRNSGSFGSREQQAREANITLMELENNAKWVQTLIALKIFY